jgi:hypothetical protein
LSDRTPSRLVAIALAFPPVVVLALFAASGAMAMVRGEPIVWPSQRVTLTEAIGMHDTGEIVRQIALGADPNARYDTWDVIKRDQHVQLTPLEAAVATREQYLFELVTAHGAMVTTENARELQCFAVQEHAREIAASLAKQFPPPGSCHGVVLPWKD